MYNTSREDLIKRVRATKHTLRIGRLHFWNHKSFGWAFEILYRIAIHIRFRPFYLRIAFPTKKKAIEWLRSEEYSEAVEWLQPAIVIGTPLEAWL
jgi:hypothetical protein